MPAKKTPPSLDAPPVITVKKVESHNSSHPDSQTLFAEVFVDGLRVGTAEDDGWGGPAFFRAVHPETEAVTAAIKRAETWAATQCYPDDPDVTLDEPLHYEGIADYALILAAQVIDERRRRRATTKYKKEILTKTFFTTATNEFRFIGAVGAPAIAVIRKKYGTGAVILSEMPEDEALATYLGRIGF